MRGELWSLYCCYDGCLLEKLPSREGQMFSVFRQAASADVYWRIYFILDNRGATISLEIGTFYEINEIVIKRLAVNESNSSTSYI